MFNRENASGDKGVKRLFSLFLGSFFLRQRFKGVEDEKQKQTWAIKSPENLQVHLGLSHVLRQSAACVTELNKAQAWPWHKPELCQRQIEAFTETPVSLCLCTFLATRCPNTGHFDVKNNAALFSSEV